MLYRVMFYRSGGISNSGNEVVNMTEEWIRELAKFTGDNIVGWSLSEQSRRIMGLIRAVAAEARKEGIEEMLCEALEAYDKADPIMSMRERAKWLKGKG